MYTSVNSAYRTAGISSSEIDEDDVKEFILDAEREVDRFTNTTYWKVELKATADSATADTLTDTGAFAGYDFEDDYVWIHSGTGSGQMRQIDSHNDDTLTLDRDWTTNPDNTSKYRIIHCGTEPFKNAELYDVDQDSDTIFTTKYPLRILESVEIDSTSVTTTNIYQYQDQGKLILSSDAEVSEWTSAKAQLNSITYWYGVYPLPREIIQLTNIYAALKMLAAQMGGTFDTPSTYSLPEGSVTIGQAYVNIKGTFDVLLKNAKQLEQSIIKYVSIF